MPETFLPSAPQQEIAAAARRAWRRYLDDTRAAAQDDYAAVEASAWRKLAAALAELGAPLEALEQDGSRAAQGVVYVAVSE